MTNEKRYFNYIVDYVYPKNSRRSYKKLLEHLYRRDFIWTIYLDKNRAADGLGLRARFGIENELDRPCSVLEMMVALADRMENHILFDPTTGDRTGFWFWNMISSMGLSSMHDENYNEAEVNHRIDIMINREYSYNGEGGLFTVENPDGDMRQTEIWYQMNWWAREKYI